MKKLLLSFTLTVCLIPFAFAQEFADFELTGFHQGTGTFENAVLPDFSWVATGTINGEIQILNDEIFDDGNAFESMFGQADYAENLRTQIYPNGQGTSGQPILSKAKLTINFDETTPGEGWGFCVVDIDVENCLISAIDENDAEVPVEEINNWLIELFDANVVEYGVNIPKWDSTHAALLGSDTPSYYTVYDSLVIGGMPDSEAAAAFFMPDIPLKSLTIKYENLQEVYYTSYHFYIASLTATGIDEINNSDVLIYPNPAGDEFKVSSLEFKVSRAFVELYDLNGRKRLEKQIPKGSEEITVDVSNLQNGLYFCRIQTENGSATKKLIIQK